jgi:hypothetical protein
LKILLSNSSKPINIKKLSQQLVDAEDKLSGKTVKVVETVQCPKCGKSMKEHSLRYTHESKCKGAPPEKKEVRRRVKVVEPSSEATQQTNIEEPVVKVRSNVSSARAQRMNAKKEAYDKIFNQAI